MRPRLKGKFAFAGAASLMTAALLVICGCHQRKAVVPPPSSNNLKYVKCHKNQPTYPGSTGIDANSTSGIDHVDDVIFVCAGENLHWKTKSGDASVASFTISFTESPFTSGHKDLSSGPQGQTGDETVISLPAGQYTKSYKYKIVVTKTDNSTITLDPQIIPMGG